MHQRRVNIVFKKEKIKTIFNPKGEYELEGERSFEGEKIGKKGFHSLRLDGKYFYACYFNKVYLHSLDPMQLLETLQCPFKGALWNVVCVNKKFCCLDSSNKKLFLYEESGSLLDEVSLAENEYSLKDNGSDWVLITSVDLETVVLYDVETTKLETVPTPSVEKVFLCCSMGGEEYCMDVARHGCREIIKCVQGSIIKSYDGASDITDVFIKDGEWVYVLEGKKKMVHILNGDFQLVLSLSVESSLPIRRISLDAEWNIYLLSHEHPPNNTKACITKYRLKM